ncbi:LL-diaminopimelate aminotransferase [Candidatus Micrarchaeota archaeon]|nr:LL-diaminopimelate aminotransferase [Candidatus Micrarchaeota archaeon]
MNIEYSSRAGRIPPYLFAELERLTAEKKKQGVDIISLGIGDPDIPTPKFVIEVLQEEVEKPGNHQYPSSQGERFYREAVAKWYFIRFGVELDPDKEVCNVMGSKEGIANIARAFVNPGDSVLVPDPAYPVYYNGATILCDGKPVVMPLLEENGFLPQYDAIPQSELKKSKMVYVNYPNNPIGAVASNEFLKETIQFALENNLILCYDNAYSEFTFDDYVAPSIFEFEGAKECAVEFHSCSKTFCMTGHRVGWAVGNEKATAGLKKIKSNIDSGCPMYIQKAGAAALASYTSRKRPEVVEKIMKEYEYRRNVLADGLNGIGVKCSKPKATFYVWARVPFGDSLSFVKKVLEQGVVITAGTGFGKYGEGYVRFALTQNEDKIKEAVERISGSL